MTVRRINTKHLFFERLSQAGQEEHKPPYTIYEHDIEKNGIKYKSLYQLYMNSVDEYDFAVNVLSGTILWDHLQKTDWFIEGYRAHRGLDAWREDLRARDESTAKKVMLMAASEGDVSAAKKLYDIAKKPTESKRGRFKKEEVIKEAAKSVEDKEFLDNAAIRLNVVSIIGT